MPPPAKEDYYEYLSENTLYDLKGGLINTGRLVRVDPDAICRCVHVYVYEGRKLTGQWLATPELVLGLAGGRKVVEVTFPNEQRERAYLKTLPDGRISLKLRVKRSEYSKWTNGRNLPETVLTADEWNHVVEIAKRTKLASEWLEAEVAKKKAGAS